MFPNSGDVLRVTRAASVQFTDPLLFRVIRVHDWATYSGWAWLDGYELNTAGDAVVRRSIFVRLSGLQAINTGPRPLPANGPAAHRNPPVDFRSGQRNRGRQPIG